jgi:hypothetical protein
MKNYQQTIKQQRVKLDKLKHSYAMNQKANWPIKEQKDILERKQQNGHSNYFYWC